MMAGEVCIIESMPPERRTQKTTVRMTVAEEKRLKEYAASQGLVLSAMLRQAGLQKAEFTAPETKKKG